MKKNRFFTYMLVALLFLSLTNITGAFAASEKYKDNPKLKDIPILMEDPNFSDNPNVDFKSSLSEESESSQQSNIAQEEALAWDTSYNPIINSMIQEVSETSVRDEEEKLTGVKSVIIEGSPYTIKSRYSKSGTPIQKATQYAYESLKGLGITTSYQEYYISDGYTNILSRNVIGEIPGTTNPEEIVLITAHLDDMPASSTKAPGADDNASGSAAVIMAAKIMSKYQFQKTIRFALFTGEEQGLLGSKAYAQKLANEGANVVAVYNADMIAYDTGSQHKLVVHTRNTTQSGYEADVAIAQVMQSVISNYNLSSQIALTISNSGESRSDHASFWSKGYPGILIIEGNFSPYYHTSRDTIYNLSIPFMTSNIRAFIGTAAHLAVPAAQQQINPINISESIGLRIYLPELKASEAA